MVNKGEKLRRRHHLEGALSDAWQAYCSFVRNLCVRSSIGCTTASGVLHLPSVAPAHWSRVSYIAVRASRNHAVLPALTNTILRKEPTWGDSGKIVAIVSALQPGNRAILLGNLGGGLTGPKHCQIVRNACAHRNHQTKVEVEALSSAYIASRIAHPTDAMLWRDPTSSTFAFLNWLDDMKTIAEGATQ